MITLQFTLAEINVILEAMDKRCDALAAAAQRPGSKENKEARRVQLTIAERIYDEIKVAQANYLVDREEQMRGSVR